MADTPHHLADGKAKPPPRLATVDDIVTRLRSYATDDKIMCDDVLIHDAADEIERLRAACDLLAEALRDETTNGFTAIFDPTLLALDAWEEARRG